MSDASHRGMRWGRVRLLLLDLLEVIEQIMGLSTLRMSRSDVGEPGFREAPRKSVGLSSAVHYELQAYRTHTQMQDYHIASQESLMTTLIAQVSSLQGQLSAALGQIQALQARESDSCR
ncbi:hypothetical protein Tco_1223522 [Tanacetum coccineum]